MKYGVHLKMLLLLFSFAFGRGAAAAGPPVIIISPAGYDFATLTVEVGSATRVFTISNAGGEELFLSGISLQDTSNYSLAAEADLKPCGKGTVLAPDESCSFAVHFRPRQEGPLDTEISVLSNDPAVPRLTVPLAGFGGMCGC